jgi:hypothetical protein
VRRTFEQLRERYPVFEFSHGHGIGVVGVGRSLERGVVDLLAADKDELARTNITRFFARLGRACADSKLMRAHERERVGEVASEDVVDVQWSRGHDKYEF